MNKSMFDTMSTASQTAYDFMSQIAELNLKTLDRLADTQMAYASDAMDKSFARVQQLSGAKGYKDVLEVQLEGSKELGQSSLDQVRKTVSLMNETRDAYGELWQKGYEQANAEVKKAAAKKPA